MTGVKMIGFLWYSQASLLVPHASDVQANPYVTFIVLVGIMGITIDQNGQRKN